eukprot:Lankesteria_metandrocarpae@DN4737_c0_g1_i2.p1
MLFGAVIKPSEIVPVASDEGQLLHLSQACLNKPSSGITYLQIITEGKKINVCALSKDKCEHAAFDLFIPCNSDVSFSVMGNNEVHVSGYFEPEGDNELADEDEMDGDDDDDDDEAEEADDDELAAQSISGKKLSALLPGKAQNKGVVLANKLSGPAAKKVVTAAQASPDAEDSEDEEEDDSDDDEQLDKALVARAMSQLKQDGDDDDDDDD